MLTEPSIYIKMQPNNGDAVLSTTINASQSPQAPILMNNNDLNVQVSVMRTSSSSEEPPPAPIDGPTVDPMQNTKNIGEELVKWLEQNGADSHKLMLCEYAPEVRGVHSHKVLVPGERILVIPKSCLITVEMGKMTDIGQKLLAHNLEFVAPKHIFLMMFLLTDMEKVGYDRKG